MCGLKEEHYVMVQVPQIKEQFAQFKLRRMIE